LFCEGNNVQGLALYCSSYGHIETMAYAVAEGARYQDRKIVDVANKLHG
jgi:hypothetical protein